MPRISRNDARFDASSIVFKLNGDEEEFVSVTYADKVTVGEARAGGTRYAVGTTPGQYKADEMRLVMHKDYHAQFIQRLMQIAEDLGYDGYSRVQHVVTVSYAEPDMAQLTDTLEGVRFLSSSNAEKEGSDPLTVEISAYVWRITYHGDVRL